jgi:hypothetical protein
MKKRVKLVISKNKCMALQSIYFATFTSETAWSDLSRLILPTDVAWLRLENGALAVSSLLKLFFREYC